MQDLEDRVANLLTISDDALRKGHPAQAVKALKEASHLQPNNQHVIKGLAAVQNSSSSHDLLDKLRAYIAQQDKADGGYVLNGLKKEPISAGDANEMLNLVFAANANIDLLAPITVKLLQCHSASRRYLVGLLAADAAKLYQKFWELGTDAFQAFVSVLLEDAVWSTKDERLLVVEKVFAMCIVQINDTRRNTALAEKVMPFIAQLLSQDCKQLSSGIQQSTFDVVLSLLDNRLSTELRSHATIVAAKIFESTSDRGEQYFTRFITTRMNKGSTDDLILAFSAAATTFPMIPSIAAKLFLTDGFVPQLASNLEKSTQIQTVGDLQQRAFDRAALQLLSAACLDKSCRQAIHKSCLATLETLSRSPNDSNQAAAALILAKIDSTAGLAVFDSLSNLVKTRQDVQAIEGLAYISLQPRIKEQITQDPNLIGILVRAVKDRSEALFGCLTIFQNLTAYRPVRTAEQKKMAQLKAYANQTKPEEEDPLDNNGCVTQRCRVLLDQDVIPAMSAVCQTSNSSIVVALITRVLLSISQEQKHRAKMAQQGAIKTLIHICDRATRQNGTSADPSTAQHDASHAVARILISVNPVHVFASSLPATSATSALLSLLSHDQDAEERNLLPVFESLLALTNLASMGREDVLNLILRSGWDKIEDLLFAPNTLVQRATVELVCNLMTTPSCVAKFADGSPDARRRITILLALTDVEDLATRRAAGGALAMLTEWDAAVKALLAAKEDRGLHAIFDMCQDESDEVKLRGLTCFANVVAVAGNAMKEAFAHIRRLHGADVLKDVLTSNNDKQILGLGVQILQSLTAEGAA